MPSELTKNVQDAIENFLALKTSDEQGHIAIDVLRSIRDESALMMERQTICDTIDSDPLNLLEDDEQNFIKMQIDRLKRQMKVISCTRSLTKDYSSIAAVVEISKDTLMKDDVNDCIRLTFAYERSQIRNTTAITTATASTTNNQTFGTSVTYHIDISKDHLQKERMIDICVDAVGLYPSVQPAEPMDEPMVEEFDNDGNLVIPPPTAEVREDKKSDSSNNNKSSETEIHTETDNEADKFAAFVDPEVLEKCLNWLGLELDLQNILFLLMTFPYYEHEWDIFGFLLECVFGSEEDDDESMETIND